MKSLFVLVFALFFASLAAAQESAADYAAAAARLTDVEPNIVYSKAGGIENRLDVYFNRSRSTPRPTVVEIHGGAWIGGSKEDVQLTLLPFLEMGFNAVNVEYRFAGDALAPAAVADVRCALRWVYAHAERYAFDTSKIVVTGDSAGGHLALMAGMLTTDAGLDFECNQGPQGRELPVAAIVNYYGITDVNDMLLGKPNERGYAVRWLGGQLDQEEIARRVSPLTYVRPGLPPILTIHGDADPTVPYEHGVRLHQALTEAGGPNQLHTVPGGRHGGFSPEVAIENYKVIRAFLHEHGIE